MGRGRGIAGAVTVDRRGGGPGDIQNWAIMVAGGDGVIQTIAGAITARGVSDDEAGGRVYIDAAIVISHVITFNPVMEAGGMNARAIAARSVAIRSVAVGDRTCLQVDAIAFVRTSGAALDRATRPDVDPYPGDGCRRG